jgi:hypothetical protein
MKIHTVKVAVDSVAQFGTGPEVYQPDTSRVQVDDDILVLDVAMDDPGFVHTRHGLDDAPEHGPCVRLRHGASLRDKVEQIDKRRRALQDEHVAVRTAVEVEKMQDAWNGGNATEEMYLHGNRLAIVLRMHAHETTGAPIIRVSPNARALKKLPNMLMFDDVDF